MKALGLVLFTALAMACSGATPTSPSADPGTGALMAAQDAKPSNHVPGWRDVRIIFQEAELRHGYDHIVGLPVYLTGFIGGASQGPVSGGWPVLTDRQSIASVDVPRTYTSLQVTTDANWLDLTNGVYWCAENRTIPLPYSNAQNRIMMHTGVQGCEHYE